MSQMPATPTVLADLSSVGIWIDADSKLDISFLGGGQVMNLEPLNGDGLLDPLRFSAMPADGIELAVAAILEANPFVLKEKQYEAPLRAALTYGVSAGATCVGDALRMAMDAHEAELVMVLQILDLARTSPMFRTLLGYDLTAPVDLADRA